MYMYEPYIRPYAEDDEGFIMNHVFLIIADFIFGCFIGFIISSIINF